MVSLVFRGHLGGTLLRPQSFYRGIFQVICVQGYIHKSRILFLFLVLLLAHKDKAVT